MNKAALGIVSAGVLFVGYLGYEIISALIADDDAEEKPRDSDSVSIDSKKSQNSKHPLAEKPAKSAKAETAEKAEESESDTEGIEDPEDPKPPS